MLQKPIALSLRSRTLVILFTLLLVGALQALLVQSLWWWIQPDSSSELGWRIGFIYSLFCLFVSGVHLLSAWVETPLRTSQQWHASEMSLHRDRGARSACRILQELTQLSPQMRPFFFLIPGREINAFSYSLGKASQYPQGAIFLTRGALNQLNESRLRVLLARQLAQNRHPSCPLSTLTCLLTSGLCSVFFAGRTLLNHAGLGYFERRTEKKGGNPLYYIGLLPMILGLPGWLMSRLVFLWLNPKDCLEIDLEICKSSEAACLLSETLKITLQFPFEDMPPSSWLMRLRGFHNHSFLENLLPLQPTIQERLQAIEKFK